MFLLVFVTFTTKFAQRSYFNLKGIILNNLVPPFLLREHERIVNVICRSGPLTCKVRTFLSVNLSSQFHSTFMLT